MLELDQPSTRQILLDLLDGWWREGLKPEEEKRLPSDLRAGIIFLALHQMGAVSSPR